SVAVPTRVSIDTGTAFEGYRAPSNWLTLLPPGSPAPAPSLAALTLSTSTVVGGGSTTGTGTLTVPAPAGGALGRASGRMEGRGDGVGVGGSMEGQVVTPPSVTVLAGGLSADFTITAPQVNAPHYVLLQATYGTTGGIQAELLEIDPGPPGTPTLLALGVNPPTGAIGGTALRATLGPGTPAPAGGGVVTPTSRYPYR